MTLPRKQTVYAIYIKACVDAWRQGRGSQPFSVTEFAQMAGLKVTGNLRRQVHGLVADGTLMYCPPWANGGSRHQLYSAVVERAIEQPF